MYFEGYTLRLKVAQCEVFLLQDPTLILTNYKSTVY